MESILQGSRASPAKRVAWEKERQRNERAFGAAEREGYGACRDAMLEFEYAAVLRDRIIELRGEK
mgnify:CR=1 FL=1